VLELISADYMDFADVGVQKFVKLVVPKLPEPPVIIRVLLWKMDGIVVC